LIWFFDRISGHSTYLPKTLQRMIGPDNRLILSLLLRQQR